MKERIIHMLRLTIANNMKRANVLVDENTTLREALESNEFDFSRGLLHLDSAPLQAGELNKTFADLGYDGTPGKDRAFISCVVKADNA